MEEVINTLEAKALYDDAANADDAYFRICRKKDRIYIDLCDEDWRVVEVTKTGFKVLEESPVKFVRHQHMKALPIPKKGGLPDLWDFINITPSEHPLIVLFVLSVFRGKPPYPILVLQGGEGTGKSTVSKILRSLIDPSDVPLLQAPKSADEMMINALNTHMLTYDNLSGINVGLSDCLCTIATGTSFTKRKLYADTDQVTAKVANPIILNGIDELATRADLLSRALVIPLPEFKPGRIKLEEEFKQSFEFKRPYLFGAICDLLVTCLSEQNYVKLPETNLRMLDALKFATPAAKSLGWSENSILEAYEKNRMSAVYSNIESSQVAMAVISWLQKRNYKDWEGTATSLLTELSNAISDDISRSKFWPNTATHLSKQLTRDKKSLQAVGIKMEKNRTSSDRFISISLIGKVESSPFLASQASNDSAFNHDGKFGNTSYSQDDPFDDDLNEPPF